MCFQGKNFSDQAKKDCKKKQSRLAKKSPPKKVKKYGFTRFWVIASSASFSLREFSTKRFPTTERRINVMSERTCKKHKYIYSQIHIKNPQINVMSERTCNRYKYIFTNIHTKSTDQCYVKGNLNQKTFLQVLRNLSEG